MAKHADTCKNGHVLTDGNVWVRPSDGDRVCRTCKNANGARYRARKREQYRAQHATLDQQDDARLKKCCRCQVEKPLRDFNRNSTTRDGRQSFCRSCTRAAYGGDRYTAQRQRYRDENRELIRARQRAAYLANPEKWRAENRLRKYGVTEADVLAMLEHQTHQCGICYDPIGINAHVDHDHKTGKVRGLLCTRCNTMLGHARDDLSHLTSAFAYLQHGPRRWSTIEVSVTLKETDAV